MLELPGLVVVGVEIVDEESGTEPQPASIRRSNKLVRMTNACDMFFLVILRWIMNSFPFSPYYPRAREGS